MASDPADFLLKENQGEKQVLRTPRERSLTYIFTATSFKFQEQLVHILRNTTLRLKVEKYVNGQECIYESTRTFTAI